MPVTLIDGVRGCSGAPGAGESISLQRDENLNLEVCGLSSTEVDQVRVHPIAPSKGTPLRKCGTTLDEDTPLASARVLLREKPKP